MKHTQQKDMKKHTMNNATAGVMGAAVGGLVGAAAGIALSDKEKRKLILKKMDELKKYVTKALDEISQMSETIPDGVSEETMMPKARRQTRPKKRQVN